MRVALDIWLSGRLEVKFNYQILLSPREGRNPGMRIESIVWLKEIVDKLAAKHRVETYAVEEMLGNRPKFHFVEKGERQGEDVYLALGQTNTGRYLTVLFIYKISREGLILSARDMAKRERRQYGRK